SQTELTATEDSLLQLYRESEQSLRSLKQTYQKKLDSLRKAMLLSRNVESFTKGLEDSLGFSNEKHSGFKSMLTRSRFKAGKFLMNLSELTVNNIFLHGGSIRYGDRFYINVSAGAYDFAFREFLRFRNDSQSLGRKYVMAIRLGREG